MTRPAEIRGVNVRSAGEHGLGNYELEGWITHSSVDAASTSETGVYSAIFGSLPVGGSRIEDNRVYAADCDHAVFVSGGSLRIGGIDVLSEPENERYLVPSTTVWSRASIINFSRSGELEVADGTFKMPFAFPARIICVRAAVGVAPTGSAVIIDTNLNGTTIFTGSGPTIAASAVVSDIVFPTTIEAPAGSYLTVDVTQIGSTLPGEDLTVAVLIENDHA